MSTYEIVRDDGVTVWQESKTRKDLEYNFLLKQRLANPDNGYTVYRNDGDLNRVGRKKTYLPYHKDKKLQNEIQERGRQAMMDIIEHSFIRFGMGYSSPFDDECDDCPDYDDYDLPTKNPKGDL